MKKIKTIEVPLIPSFEIIIWREEQNNKYYKKILNLKQINENKYSDWLFVSTWNWIYIFLNKTKIKNKNMLLWTFIHELTHLILFEFDFKWINYSSKTDSDEVLSYYIQRFFEKYNKDIIKNFTLLTKQKWKKNIKYTENK